MKIFSIGDIKIGANVVPLVIPEIGINHNGSLDVAKLMVDSAYNAGARLIKHQTHVIDDEMTHEAKTVIPGNTNKSIYEVMKDAALSEDDEWQLMKYVESKNMEYLSTPFSKAAADRLESFGVKGYKIGSGEMNNYPLLKYVASFGKPMIVSTGMNDLKSVNKTVNILKSFEIPFALLHTTNIYPTPPQLVRLGAMKQLIDEYQDIPVGLSDHTINNNACIAAIGLGATIVERHYTDTMLRHGPDIVCSMDESKLKELLVAASEVYLMRGGDKTILKEEQVTRDFAFATVVSVRDIKIGDKFTTDNIWVKRPGTGEILAEEYESIIGKKSLCNISRDCHLKRNMIGE